MRGRCSTLDGIVARIATRAHGVVTRAELLTEGVRPGQIDRRIAKGALIPEYPGVYRAGHRARSRESDYMAAVKAGRAGAVLCGEAAAHMLAILKGPTWPPPVVMTTSSRGPNGLKRRRVRSVDRRDVTSVNGIPTTTPARTLVDLAATLDEEELARACHLAFVVYRVAPKHIEQVLERMPRTKGAAKLRRIASGDSKVLLSQLEKRFLRRLIADGLPLPETNRRTDGHYVDCRWPHAGLTVELDGWRFHNSRWSWEQAGERERAAYARRDAFRRYGYKDVVEAPERMLAELRELLG